MSHIATVQTEIKSLAALKAACKRLKLPEPKHGTHQLYGDQTATGYGVQLPGWRYPAVFDLKTRKVRYDNFAGCWGAEKELDRLKQAYAVCAARQQAERQGFRIQEQQKADGSIQLVCSK